MFKPVDVIDGVEELLSVLESMLRPGSPVVEDMCSHVLPESHQVTANDKKTAYKRWKKIWWRIRAQRIILFAFPSVVSR